MAVQQPVPAVRAALEALARELDERGSGLELREVAGGVRLYTRPEHAGVVTDVVAVADTFPAASTAATPTV